MASPEPTPAGRRVLFLTVRVPAANQNDLIAFLRRAVPVYEEPDGVQVRLYQSSEDPERWLEIIDYPDQATFDADQLRVEGDSRMRALIEEWRGLLDGPVEVEAWNDWTHLLKPAPRD